MNLSLNYRELSQAASGSEKLANALDDYCDSLSKKVQKKMYDVTGGMSSALNTADYYVDQKIRNLRGKSSNARSLAKKISHLLGTAKRVDSDVKATIEANQKNLFEKHADLRPSSARLHLTSFLCGAKKVPVIGALIGFGEDVGRGYKKLKNEIRCWYKQEGGKELVGIVLSAVAAVLAVVAVVCAVVFTGGTILAVIAGVAGFIGALIGVVNAVTNIVTSVQAYEAATGGHPGRAKIYAGQDKLSDVLRDTNYRDRNRNHASNAAATGLDLTETVCDMIGLINGIHDAAEDLKSVNLKKVFRAVCQPRSDIGTFVPGKPSIWNGLKTITAKINGKDMILGDLNVKNLYRLSLLSKPEAFKAIGKFGKAASGIVEDLDQINEGSMGLTAFTLKRIVTGLDQSMFQQEEWVAKKREHNGLFQKKAELYSTFDKTKLSTVIQGMKDVIDKLGVGKILIDLPGNAALSDVFSPGDGLIGEIQDLIKTSRRQWRAPKIVIDASSLQAGAVTNWDSAQGYSKVRVQKIPAKSPVLYMRPDLLRRSYIVPWLCFSLLPMYRYPYFNFGGFGGGGGGSR